MHPTSDTAKTYGNAINAGMEGNAKGMTMDAAMPAIIPQKYPYPLNLHQYHLKIFDAVYPPYSALTIQRVT